MCPMTDTQERIRYSGSWLNITFGRMSRFHQNLCLCQCLCGRSRAQSYTHFCLVCWIEGFNMFNTHSRNSKSNFIKVRSVNTQNNIALKTVIIYSTPDKTNTLNDKVWFSCGHWILICSLMGGIMWNRIQLKFMEMLRKP